MIDNIKAMKIFILITFYLFFGACIASAFTSHTFVSCFRSCHNLHGSPSGDSLLAGVDTELTCLICHDTVSPKNLDPEPPVAAIHDPGGYGMGSKGYITCRECHDPHGNEDNVLGGENYKLVGSLWDPELDPSKSNRFAFASIREELPTSDYNSPVYVNVVFEQNTNAVNAPHDERLDFNRRDDDLGVCEVCHEPGPPSGADTDLANHQWGECTSCHKHEDGFIAHQCVECHDTESTFGLKPANAPEVLNSAIVTPGSHLLLLAGGSYPDTADSDWDRQWTIRCLQCHPGHGDNSDHDGDGVFGYELDGFVKVPNYNNVGIRYNSTGGIFLGGLGVTEMTEAETCWGCHTSTESEWNALTDHGITVRADAPSTDNENWTTVEFDLDGSTVPTTTTRSIHSSNVDLNESVASSVTNNIDWDNTYGNGANALVPHNNRVLEDIDEIRCSYCHDVHDLNAAPNDITSGRPYLRGSWLHNPYVATDIERPPESGDSWSGNRWSHFDSGDTVPRLRTDATDSNIAGGYQIDQNNSYPTSTYLNSANLPDELTESAGLCVLCHGTDVDGMDYFTTENLWNSPNGHANAVLGGSGYNAVSLFDARNRDGQLSTAMGFFMAAQGADIPNIDQWGDDRPSGFGEDRKALLPYGDNASDSSQRPDEGNSSGNSATPPLYTGYYTNNAGSTRATTSLPANYTAWYSATGIGTNAGTSGRAHDFSCSKCHTPHASRLPALLVTNCLDYTISDWSVSASGPNGGGSITLGPTATNRWALEAMNNCHRKKNITTGWNVLAPQQ